MITVSASDKNLSHDNGDHLTGTCNWFAKKEEEGCSDSAQRMIAPRNAQNMFAQQLYHHTTTK